MTSLGVLFANLLLISNFNIMQTAVSIYLYISLAQFALRNTLKTVLSRKKKNTLKAFQFYNIKTYSVMGKNKDTGKFGNRSITAAEMESLASFCEAVLPPVSPPEAFSGIDDHHRNKEALRSFYSSSGSQTPIVRQVHTLFFFKIL